MITVAPSLRHTLLAAALVGGLVRFAPAQTAPSTAPQAEWFDSLDAGYAAAQKSQKPILVLISNASSDALWDDCLKNGEVADRLNAWVLVRIDGDARDVSRTLGVAHPPALRALTPLGRIIARGNDIPSPAALAQWLDASKAAASPAAASSSETNIAELTARLGAADTEAREAAVRQLLARPKEAATAVVDALAGSDTTARISAADLLEAWHAPLADLDPWRRETVTADRLAALRSWAANLATNPATAPSDQPDPSNATAAQEFDALLSAPTAVEARAVRERMVRFGDSIMQQIHQRLRETRSEETRFRLTALRYRLTASDTLASAWPGGFDRLASADTATRRAAMAELAQTARAEDSRILLELFGADDPFMREKALSVLKSVRGAETNQVLIRLLGDPELNVRAAVLKSLSEDKQIDPMLADKLIQYVATEPDADLVIHAIHVLSAVPGNSTIDALTKLLKHSEWRVRAEAVEALGKKLTPSYGEEHVPDNIKAASYAAIIKLLSDDEGYVISKTVAALAGSSLKSAIDPMMNVIEARPEMAPEILKIIASNADIGKIALDKIRPLVKHPRPDVRAAAVTAVCQTAPSDCGTELKLALADTDAQVRAAGLSGLLTAFTSMRPQGGFVTKRGWFGMSETRERVDVWQWVDNFRSGKGRAAWIADIAKPIESAFANDTGDSKLQAAVALCAIGRDSEVMPTLLTAAADMPSQKTVVLALSWLPWDQRAALFHALAAAPSTEIDQALLLISEIPDPRAADLVWDSFAGKTSKANLSISYNLLRKIYFGDNYFNMEAVSAKDKHVAHDALTKKVATGSEPQKTIALGLLLMLDNDEANKTATAIADNPASSELLRREATQVELLSLESAQADELAIKVMDSAVTRAIAVRYLAGGPDAIQAVDGDIYLQTSRSSSDSWNHDGPVVVKSPAGLKSDLLRETLNDPDKETAAYAGYLLALTGDPKGFAALESKWRSEDLTSMPWTRLVYRAIAKMNDDQKTPILDEIYKAYAKEQKYQLREFYWTIRTMSGERILKLRKKIRDEIGMQQLQ